jgi:long-chain acyl-CoA synthetase
MIVREIIQTAAPLYGQRPIIHFNGKELSYPEFVDLVDKLAAAFVERGLKPNDRVMILAKNSPEWIASYFAVLACGGVAVPVNPALTANEVSYIVDHAAPTIAMVDPDTASSLQGRIPHIIILGPGGNWENIITELAPLRTIVSRKNDDLAVIFYTSGTTGRPKGVMLGHGAVCANADIVRSLYELSPSDSTLVTGSLSFIYSIMTNCTSAISSGVTIHLLERFHPEHVLRTIERDRITLFLGVPTMYVMMLGWAKDKSVDTSSIRLTVCSGATLPWNLLLAVRERFRWTLLDLWGMTEGTPITSYGCHEEPRQDSCGHAVEGCGVRVVDDSGIDVAPGIVGEVLLSGPPVMLGYFNNPTATAETLHQGWVRTGDLGKLDADGFLSIVGRQKDLIIRGGANIYPTEVEDALYGHPAVAECAVIGQPDDVYGEIVKAVIVFKEGCTAATSANSDSRTIRFLQSLRSWIVCPRDQPEKFSSERSATHQESRSQHTSPRTTLIAPA